MQSPINACLSKASPPKKHRKPNAEITQKKRSKQILIVSIGKGLSWQWKEGKMKKDKLNFSIFLNMKERELHGNLNRDKKKKNKEVSR